MTMAKLITLQLKVAYGVSVLRWYKSNDRLKFLGNMAIALVVIVSLIPLFIIYWRILDGLYLGAAMFRQGEVVITVGVVAGSLMVFLLGIAYVMSSFYFSKDLNFLLALPVRPSAVMAAKFAVVLTGNYITTIPFVLPALVVYGAYNGITLAYLFLGLIVFLTLPWIPLSLASVLVMLLMKHTHLAQRRDMIRMAGMLGMIILIVMLNIFLSRVPEGMEAEYIQSILFREEGLVSFFGRLYPPALLATRALVHQGSSAVMNMLSYVLLSLLAAVAAVMIGDKVFYQGLIGGSEVTAKKALTTENLERRLSKQRSPLWAITVREIRSLLRTPIYLFNSIGIIFMVPVLLIVPLWASGGFQQIQQALTMVGSRIILVLGLAGFMAASALFAPAASSSFSREGKTFWISKMMPVHPAVQIHAKILYSFLISLLSIPLIAAAAVFLIPVSFSEFVLVIVLGVCFSFPAITSNLLVDFLRPFLTWDDPQRAIKQNMNVLVGMIVGGLLLYLIYLAVQWTMIRGWPAGSVYLTAGAIAGALGWIPYGVMMKIAGQQYDRIEI